MVKIASIKDILPINALSPRLVRYLLRLGILLLALACCALAVRSAWAARSAADVPPVCGAAGCPPQAQFNPVPGQTGNEPQPTPINTQQPAIVTVTRLAARPNTSPVVELVAFVFLALLFGSAWLPPAFMKDEVHHDRKK